MPSVEQRLTFGNCHEMLRLNGYAPVPLGTAREPIGPWCVMQADFARNRAFNDLAPAVLTSCPRLRGSAPKGSMLIDNPGATWLAVVRVTAREEIWPAVDAILGAGPVRVADDGARLYVFATTDNGDRGFGDIAASSSVPGLAGRAVCANNFIALDGAWPKGNLFDVRRDELPVLNASTAQLKIAELDALFQKYAPPPRVLGAYVSESPPILAPGEPLLFGNKRAVQALLENGYDACPVEWGDVRPSSKWYKSQASANAGIVWDKETQSHGVGLYAQLNPRGRDRWLAVVELTGPADLVEVADACVAKRIGAGPVRVGSDGSRLRLFRMDTTAQTAERFVAAEGPAVRVRIGSRGETVVVSGNDAAGEPYEWEGGDPLTVPRDELPELCDWQTDWLCTDMAVALKAHRASVPVEAAPIAAATTAVAPARRSRQA